MSTVMLASCPGPEVSPDPNATDPTGGPQVTTGGPGESTDTLTSEIPTTDDSATSGTTTSDTTTGGEPVVTRVLYHPSSSTRPAELVGGPLYRDRRRYRHAAGHDPRSSG